MAVETEGMVKRVRILHDPDAESPREWDNLGTMVCWHRRYNLGDEQPTCSPMEFFHGMMQEIHPNIPDELPAEHVQACIEKHYIVLPLYLYDHSGITMSCSSFSCPWDSGQVGFIYVSMKTARLEFTGTGEQIREQAERCLRSEVEVYDHYLTGQCYGFVIEQADDDADLDDDDSWEQIDSCWGFYGDDWKTNGIKEHLSPHEQDVVVED